MPHSRSAGQIPAACSAHQPIGTNSVDETTHEPDVEGAGNEELLERREGRVRTLFAVKARRKPGEDLIKSVEWYTFQDEFSKDAEPKPIAVHAFEKEDEVTTEVRNWPYLNATTKLELRGVLVARVVAGGKTVHFIEIQRRPQRRKDKTGDFKDSEESYKGLVFVLEDQLQFETWLKRLLSDIRHVKGVWQRLVGFCPGNAAVFKHTPSSGEQVSCEAAVMNALEKVGVTKIKSHKVNVDLRDK